MIEEHHRTELRHWKRKPRLPCFRMGGTTEFVAFLSREALAAVSVPAES